MVDYIESYNPRYRQACELPSILQELYFLEPIRYCFDLDNYKNFIVWYTDHHNLILQEG